MLRWLLILAAAMLMQNCVRMDESVQDLGPGYHFQVSDAAGNPLQNAQIHLVPMDSVWLDIWNGEFSLFNTTTICFDLPEAAVVDLRLLDSCDSLVLHPVDGEILEAGTHAQDIDTGLLPAGYYNVELETDGVLQDSQLMLVLHSRSTIDSIPPNGLTDANGRCTLPPCAVAYPDSITRMDEHGNITGMIHPRPLLCVCKEPFQLFCLFDEEGLMEEELYEVALGQQELESFRMGNSTLEASEFRKQVLWLGER